jgi:hypothetical protein
MTEFDIEEIKKDAGGDLPGPKVTEQDISSVIDCMVKEAKHDRPAIKQLFYALLSGMTNLGIHHKVNSKDSGAGKTYVTKIVASYFPQKQLMNLAGVTDKAFFYMRGEMVINGKKPGEFVPVKPLITELKMSMAKQEDGEKLTREKKQEILDEIERLNEESFRLIDLRFTDIILGDTPQEGLLNAIMSILSQDSENSSYLYTDKNKMQAVKNVVVGMPVFIYTRVIDDTKNPRAEEVFRRFVNVTPNVTKQKIKTANELTFMKMGTLTEQYENLVISREDKNRAKEIVTDLIDKLIDHSNYLGFKESGILIPFIRTLANILPSDEVFMMTVGDRFARYLAIVTKSRMDSRPRFVRKDTGAFFPISTFADLKETFELMESAGGNVRSYLAIFYNTVLVPFCDAMDKPGEDLSDDGVIIAKQSRKGRTAAELIEQTKLMLGFTPSRTEMHNKYLTPMLNLGLINWEKNVKKGSEHIYFPADEDAKKVFTLFPDCDMNDLKLVVKDKDHYPSKNVLEKDYGLNSILTVQQGGSKNIFDIYRLEEHEGNEITISKLIDNYLSDPETCFKEGWDEMKPSDSRGDENKKDTPSRTIDLDT